MRGHFVAINCVLLFITGKLTFQSMAITNSNAKKKKKKKKKKKNCDLQSQSQKEGGVDREIVGDFIRHVEHGGFRFRNTNRRLRL